VESEARAGRQGRLADYLTRLDFYALDELGYLPFGQAGGGHSTMHGAPLLFAQGRSGK
jgi:hypothetical protein